MKKLPLAVLAILAVACTNVETRKTTSPSFTYTDDAGKSRFVTGELSYGGWGGKWLTVKIDGAEAIKGDLDQASTSGTVAGTHEGKTVVANCTSKSRAFSWDKAVRCTVARDGKQIGLLTF